MVNFSAPFSGFHQTDLWSIQEAYLGKLRLGKIYALKIKPFLYVFYYALEI